MTTIYNWGMTVSKPWRRSGLPGQPDEGAAIACVDAIRELLRQCGYSEAELLHGDIRLTFDISDDEQSQLAEAATAEIIPLASIKKAKK